MTQSLLPKITNVPKGTTYDLVEHDFSRGEPANYPCSKGFGSLSDVGMLMTQGRGGPLGLWTSLGVSNLQVR